MDTFLVMLVIPIGWSSAVVMEGPMESFARYRWNSSEFDVLCGYLRARQIAL